MRGLNSALNFIVRLWMGRGQHGIVFKCRILQQYILRIINYPRTYRIKQHFISMEGRHETTSNW